MASISAALIKELRDRTGVGMGKCKEALEEANGDIELAITILRKSGIASAVKKEGRETKEGMIGSAENNGVIAIVEVGAETDFVAKNDRFKQFVEDIAQEVAKANPSSIEQFLQQKYSKEPTLTIDEYRSTFVQAIGENIQIKRFTTFKKSPEVSFGLYSHQGQVFTVVEIKGTSGEEELAKDIAMQVAASSPEYLSPEQVPHDIVEREKEIARSQIEGKPENIKEKIVEGKLGAFYDNVCLVRQKYIKDDSLNIGELVAKRAKEVGKPLVISNFFYWSVS
jgi:elongation factor Ts